jgi:hypothetical protein
MAKYTQIEERLERSSSHNAFATTSSADALKDKQRAEPKVVDRNIRNISENVSEVKEVGPS